MQSNPALTDHTGIITYWELDSQTDPDLLREGLERIAIFDIAPEPRTWKASLKAALAEIFSDEKKNKRDLIRGTKDKQSYSVVEEERDEDRNYYTHNFSAKVDENGTLSVTGGAAPSSEIRQLMGHYRRVLPGASVSQAMVNYVDRLHGVRLKENGGLYYIPAFNADRWRAFANVIESSAVNKTENHVTEIPMAFTENSVLAVRRALVREVTAKLDAMKAEVEKGDLGEEALLNRQAAIKPIRDYIASYEGILQDTLGELTAALDSVKNTITMTAMQLMAI